MQGLLPEVYPAFRTVPDGVMVALTLGIPTVTDRIAQMTARLILEPKLEPCFHADSYGYRPGRSAHQALATARQRCWEYDWVIDLDIKGFFDTIDHELLLKAVDHHKPPAWIRLYIERWLKAPAQDVSATITPLTRFGNFGDQAGMAAVG